MTVDAARAISPEPSPPLLSLRGVSKRYPAPGGAVEALRDVSLTLDPGEFCAVTGPSGSGKTTLLHIAALLEPPTEGEVRFEGEDAARLSDRGRAARRARKIGMVFQRFCLLPHRRVLDNVRFRFRYAPVPGAEAERLARDALAAVGLSARAAHRARLLSGGEMQRAAIARAIALPPRLLAADEPTGNLDRASAEEILEVLRALQRRGVAVLLATHNEALLRPGDRWLRLEDGRLVSDRRR